MKHFVYALCLSLSLALGLGSANAADEKQNIVVHLSEYTADLHRATMAVKLATALQQAGAEVTLFVDLEGVRLVDKNIPQDLSWGFGPKKSSMGELFDGFVKAGGKVMVCPHCAHAAGVATTAVKAGAQVAKDADEIAKLLLKADKILDY